MTEQTNTSCSSISFSFNQVLGIVTVVGGIALASCSWVVNDFKDSQTELKTEVKELRTLNTQLSSKVENLDYLLKDAKTANEKYFKEISENLKLLSDKQQKLDKNQAVMNYKLAA